MRIENPDKQKIKEICQNLTSKLLIHPLFMYYCPEKAARREYVNSYFNYFIPIWSKDEILLTNDENSVLISIVNPRNYKYKFKGKGASGMNRFKVASNVFEHQNDIENIFDVVATGEKDARVMHIYANINTEFEQIQELVKEAMHIAEQENIMLLYDTFSLRLQPLMRAYGFKLAYNKNFLDTNFLHSVMIYNF